MNIRLIRHGMHQIHYGDQHLLVDPIFNSKGTSDPIPGAEDKRSNPLVELPVALEFLVNPDGILVTHTHQDHFDDAAAQYLSHTCPLFCQPQDVKKLKGKGFQKVEAVKVMQPWEGIEIHRIGGTHGTGLTRLMLNPVSGYVLKKAGEPTLYITGDTVWCKEVKEALDEHQPQWIVCFGGAAKLGGDTITMDIEDFKRIREHSPESKLIVIHMETWNHCSLTRNQLRQWISETGQEAYFRVPEDGETVLCSSKD